MSLEFTGITFTGGFEVQGTPSEPALIVKESYPGETPAFILLQNDDTILTE